MLSPGSGVTQAQSASEPTVIQVKAGRTWSVWQLAQVDLGATYCINVTVGAHCVPPEKPLASAMGRKGRLCIALILNVLLMSA